MWLRANPTFADPISVDLFSDDDCDRLIEQSEADDSWAAAGVYGEHGNRVDPLSRSVRGTRIEGTGRDWPLREILDAVAEVNDQAFRCHLEVIPASDRPSVLRYDANSADHFVTHMDAGKGSPTRKLTFIVQLSRPNAYKGCDLLFTGSRSVGTRTRGALIVFPSYTFHHVTPIMAGTRYAVVGWVHGPTFT